MIAASKAIRRGGGEPCRPDRLDWVHNGSAVGNVISARFVSKPDC